MSKVTQITSRAVDNSETTLRTRGGVLVTSCLGSDCYVGRNTVASMSSFKYSYLNALKSYASNNLSCKVSIDCLKKLCENSGIDIITLRDGPDNLKLLDDCRSPSQGASLCVGWCPQHSNRCGYF